MQSYDAILKNIEQQSDRYEARQPAEPAQGAPQVTLTPQAPHGGPERAWPPASLEAERRFSHSSARLYPFLGSRVRTPRGTGQLIQVFTDRVAVLLDGADRLSFFAPEDICPLQLM